MTGPVASMLIPPRTILQVDCLYLLERLPNRCAKLIYLDPPWHTNEDIAISARVKAVKAECQRNRAHAMATS